MFQKAHFLVAPLVALFAALLGPSAHAAAPPGYKLAWQDEFDGTVLDAAKWQYRTDTRYWSTQQPQNVSVSGGLLHLHLKKETVGTVNYTAGGVISKNLVRYGYYEARMKIPPGGGWHTSFWMMKYNRPATDTVAIELDVIENDSVTPLKYAVNVHRHLPLPHLTFGTKPVTTPSLSADFHIFGCEFTPTTVRYLFDGAVVQTVDASQFPHDDMNIWLTSIAAPLGGTTSVDDTKLPAEAQFDYVRYYEPFPAPTVSIVSPSSPGVSIADSSQTLQLNANVTAPSGTPTIAWSSIAGPGTVTFSTPASAQTTATFSAPGSYTLQCAATNEGGTNSARIDVGVAAPITLALRQGNPGYSHTATTIRSDYPDWNAGARDQILAGRNGAMRALFSFDLTPLQPGSTIQAVALDLKTLASTGTIGDLQLRKLTATPTEGDGISDSTSAYLGTGTGATWLTRTGGTTASDLWTTPGGDFANNILSTLPGYDATIAGEIRTLPSSTALVAAAQAARDSSQPLDLILTTATATDAAAFTRLASDDALLPDDRPQLNITFIGNLLPTVSTGPPPAATAGIAESLLGNAAGATSSLWQSISGPAAVTFGNSASPATTAIFPTSGTYLLKLTATSPLGSVERTLAVTAALNPAIFTDWQTLAWPGSSDLNVIGPNADPDGDGLNNLLEWALYLDPKKPDTFDPIFAKTGTTLEFTYTRRKDAAATFQLEWSDTLLQDWSSSGISPETLMTENPNTTTIKLTLPAGDSNRFVRLRISQP